MKRPRIPDDLFEVLEEKKSHPNENIGDVMKEEFPELEEEMEQKKQEKQELFEEQEENGDWLEDGLLD